LIGNRVDAQLIYDYHHDLIVKRPVGWKEIGNGSTRTAYLSPEKVVYKVGESENNIMETHVARSLRTNKSLAKHNVFVPKSRNWQVKRADPAWGREYVCSMEYIKTRAITDCGSIYGSYRDCDCKPNRNRPCYSEVYKFLTEKMQLQDMWDGNLHYSNKKFYLIDLGAGRLFD
jgi:hypothetical protein